MKKTNKKIIMIGASLLILASGALAYGGGQGNGNSGGCHGDSSCMAQKQGQVKKINIDSAQSLKQNNIKNKGNGYGKSYGQQGLKSDSQDCTELDDVKDGQKYELNSREEEYIAHMREEEKIARDVYITLYEKWGIKTFDNIKNAEQKHMDAIKILIDKYNLEDSMKSDKIGDFNNPEFQKLYNDLIEKGMKSEIDALQVGMTIEDVDIYDLEKYMNETNNQDVKVIFNNLNNGSINHAKAFKRQLDRKGGAYSAQFITEKRLQEVLNSENSHGKEHGHLESGENNYYRNDVQNKKESSSEFWDFLGFLKFWNWF